MANVSPLFDHFQSSLLYVIRSRPSTQNKFILSKAYTLCLKSQNMPLRCLAITLSYAFCSKFHFQTRLRFDKASDSLKVGTFWDAVYNSMTRSRHWAPCSTTVGKDFLLTKEIVLTWPCFLHPTCTMAHLAANKWQKFLHNWDNGITHAFLTTENCHSVA